jgi:hypothetical protein
VYKELAVSELLALQVAISSTVRLKLARHERYCYRRFIEQRGGKLESSE